MREFRDGVIQILCNVDIVSEGTDVPMCDCIMLGLPTLSLTRYLQHVGRGMRIDHGRDNLVLDLVGNFHRHGRPDIERHWDLHQRADDERDQDRVVLPRQKVCVHCATVYPANKATCPTCGQEQPIDTPNHLDIDLIGDDIPGGRRQPATTMAAVRQELQRVIRGRGRAQCHPRPPGAVRHDRALGDERDRGAESMKHVVSFSGGVTSWATGRVVRNSIMDSDDTLVLLFADTMMEAADVYAFIKEGAANIGVQVTRIADGRNPWQVFRDERFLGNSRIDPCSKILKRKLMDRWRAENCDPENSCHYIGMDFSEINRSDRHIQLMKAKGWEFSAPLIDARISKPYAIEWAQREGLTLPAAYAQGFSHANCGGKCVKAGQGHWARLLRLDPAAYREAEAEEQELRLYLGRDVTILKDRSGGASTNLSLAEFRERVTAKVTLPFEDEEHGGCGCALESGEE